jgi:uncharacterized membrane protein (UPF0127 family)
MTIKRIAGPFVLIALIFCLHCKNELQQTNKHNKKPPPFVVIQNETLFVEISDNLQERRKGLMFRDKLGKNQGMIFIFEQENLQSFWMKNTSIPLSIGFINSKKIIVDIQHLKPMSTETHLSRFPCIYALEVNQGWFEKHLIGVGDTVSLHF